jgi:hypothetical protein
MQTSRAKSGSRQTPQYFTCSEMVANSDEVSHYDDVGVGLDSGVGSWEP